MKPWDPTLLSTCSPMLAHSTGMGAWSMPMHMDIDDAEAATTNVFLTLMLPTNQELNRMEQENKHQKKTIGEIQQQIHDLKLSEKELVDHKDKEQEEKAKF